MDRRQFLKASAAAPLVLPFGGGLGRAQDAAMWDDSPEGRKWHTEALAAFPFDYEEVSGKDALGAWERLKLAGRGAPVIVGDLENFRRVVEAFHPDAWQHAEEPVLAETLAVADGLRHPQDLVALRRAEGHFLPEGVDAQSFEALDLSRIPEEHREYAELMFEASHPPLGTWPDPPPPQSSEPLLSVAMDFMTGGLYDRVFIILVPTDDPATIPAYLRWGGWNENPPPEYHVAALRSWGQRYGAELVGLGADAMNIRVARRPETREEALALARELHTLCFDMIYQGFDSLSNLGAALTTTDWWVLWWD